MPRRKQSSPGCLTALLRLVFRKRGKSRECPYTLNASILTAHELRFYKVLQPVVGTNLIICPKVRLADFLSVSNREDFWTDFNKISQRHIDFLLCDPDSLRPRVGIELDDSSHDSQDRKERDQFVQEVYDAVGLPLVRVRGKQAFNSAKLTELIAPHLPELAKDATQASDPLAVPRCPICGGEMKIRTARNDKYAGRKFHVCLNYPECRGLVPVTEKTAV